MLVTVKCSCCIWLFLLKRRDAVCIRLLKDGNQMLRCKTFLKEMHDFIQRERSFDFMLQMSVAIKEAIFVCGLHGRLRTNFYNIPMHYHMVRMG